MEYTRLGTSGLKVSKIILGTMSFGSSKWQKWVLDEGPAIDVLLHAYSMGINTWDTADVYSNGVSESIIRKALQRGQIPRDNVVLMTKCYYGVDHTGQQRFIPEMSVNDGPSVNQVGLSRKHLISAVCASCERLGGTYIDVLQIHRLDDTPMEEIVDALHYLIEVGYVHYVGASTMHAYEFQELQHTFQVRHQRGFASMQGLHNLLYREEEREMKPYCAKAGIGFVGWSPLARGMLTRPTDDPQATIRSESDHFLPIFVDAESSASKVIRERLEAMAITKGVTMSTVALAWCLRRQTIPVVGCVSKRHLEEACQALTIDLSEANCADLEAPYEALPVAGFQ